MSDQDVSLQAVCYRLNQFLRTIEFSAKTDHKLDSSDLLGLVEETRDDLLRLAAGREDLMVWPPPWEQP